MLDALTARAQAAWGGWFAAETEPALEPLLLAGGPAHRDRVSVLLFTPGSRQPGAIMKIGFSPQEGSFLESEYGAMSRLHPLLPPDLASLMPRPLDLWQDGGVTVVIAEVLPGRRLLVPSLTGSVSRAGRRTMDLLFRHSFAFSRELADSTATDVAQGGDGLQAIAEGFVRMFCAEEPEVESRILSFARAVGQAQITWRPVWQHQDIAVGNVLEHRGRLLFVDWEHASDGCQPWFDVAYTPVVTAHLALRVDSHPTIEAAALAVLASETQVGSILRRRMEEVWDYPLPLSWGVCLTGMIGAMRRLEDQRAVSPEWADFVKSMLTDDEFRRRLAWLAPEW